jgi:hypothetical protein
MGVDGDVLKKLGTSFIRIPKTLMLHPSQQITNLDPICSQVPSVALTLQLLMETRNSTNSLHSLYIASLPSLESEELNAAWLWDLSDIESLLFGTTAFAKCIRTRLSTLQHYIYIIGRVM